MEDKKLIHGILMEKANLISSLNHKIWGYAEPGYQEIQSSREIINTLLQEGFVITENLANISTAFVGTYGHGMPVIGILAEYDALPGLSQSAGCSEYNPIKEDGYGHGCGHCALGAGAVGAAIIVKEYIKRKKISGTVKLFGCPAEETGFGKTIMVKENCFDKIDAAFSWHPLDKNMSLAVRTLAYYKVKFEFRGTTSHAGLAPEKGRSALDACELMNVGVNYLREHIIPDARIHYSYLDSGGKAPNVVQAYSSLLYFIRAPKLYQCNEILERVKKISLGAALMTETEVNVSVLGGISDTIPNPTLSAILSDAYLETGGVEFSEKEFEIGRVFLASMPKQQKDVIVRNGALQNNISEENFLQRPLNTFYIPYNPQMMEKVMMHSSDLGDVSYIVPLGQIAVTVGIPETEVHTWRMTAQVGTSIGDKASQAAAKAIALACIKVYKNPQILEKAKRELVSETKGIYISPIPTTLLPQEIDDC